MYKPDSSTKEAFVRIEPEDESMEKRSSLSDIMEYSRTVPASASDADNVINSDPTGSTSSKEMEYASCSKAGELSFSSTTAIKKSALAAS